MMLILPGAVASYALPNGTAPLTVADFKNGVYMLDGAAVASTEVVEAIASWDPSWSVASNVTPGVGSNGNPCVNQALGQSLLAQGGITLVATLNASSGVYPVFSADSFDDPDFAQTVGITLGTGITPSDTKVYVFGVSQALFEPQPGVSGRNILAWSIKDSGALIIGSVNGSATATTAVGGALVVNSIGFDIQVGYIESIGIYPLQADADLPTLSAL